MLRSIGCALACIIVFVGTAEIAAATPPPDVTTVVLRGVGGRYRYAPSGNLQSSSAGRLRYASDERGNDSGLPKPPRPNPVDELPGHTPATAEPRPKTTKKRRSNPVPVRPAPAAQTPAAPVSQSPQKTPTLPPGTDRGAVARGAIQFRGLLGEGRVRFLNAERDRAQIDRLCENGLFQWPSPGAAQSRPETVVPDPDESDSVEPDVLGFYSRALSPSASRSLLPARSVTPALAMPITQPPSELFQMLNGLAAQSTDQKPLTIASLLRPPYRTARYAMQSPTNPHALGLAVDIVAFGGHAIVTADPEEEVQAVMALLSALPPGRYRMGMPKAPAPARPANPGVAAPNSLAAGAMRPGASAESSRAAAPLPSRGVRRQDPPRAQGAPQAPGPDARAAQQVPAPAPWPFFPPPQRGMDASGRPVTLFGNEHYAAEQYLNDPRLRKAMADARSRGADVFALFPDGVNHVHVDVKPNL